MTSVNKASCSNLSMASVPRIINKLLKTWRQFPDQIPTRNHSDSPLWLAAQLTDHSWLLLTFYKYSFTLKFINSLLTQKLLINQHLMVQPIVEENHSIQVACISRLDRRWKRTSKESASWHIPKMQKHSSLTNSLPFWFSQKFLESADCSNHMMITWWQRLSQGVTMCGFQDITS